jgi:FkbM family methyltransferase
MLKPGLFIKRFGIFEGMRLYWKFRYGKTNELILSDLRHPLYMKPNSIDNHSFYEIFLKEDYNLELPFRNEDDLFIIDAGANVGFSAVFFANKFPNAKIIAIEPDTENFNWLLKNTFSYDSIVPVNGAVWYQDIFMEIVDEGWGTRGYMVNETKSKKDGSIKGFSISSIMKEYGKNSIDILKMDIEGSEKEVFESNFEYWLPKTKCLIIELHDRMKPGCSSAVEHAISNYNFERFESGENLVFINKEIEY